MKKWIISNVMFIICLALTINFLFPPIYRSWLKIQKLDEDVMILSARIENLKHKIASYKYRIDIMDDEFQREKVARNKLQMIKDQEEIYRFINKKQEEL